MSARKSWQVAPVSLAGAFILMAGTAVAQSTCPPGTRLNQTQLENTFSGNTLCAARGSEQWQEQHRAGGQLWDYKRGPGSTVDPTAQVGSWLITDTGSNAVLTHTYGASYSWAVCGPGGVGVGYTLISTGAGGTISGASVKAGATSC